MPRRASHRLSLAVMVMAAGLGLAGNSVRAQSGRGSAAAVRDSLEEYERQIQTQEGHLQDLRNQIRDLRKQDQQLKKQEVGTLAQLKILDKEVALTSDLLRQLGRKQQRLEAQL